MLEPILAMYSTPTSPLYRQFGSGVLTVDSLKAAGVFAARKSAIGWLLILAKSGDKNSAVELVRKLTPYSGALVATGAIYSLIPTPCQKCNGTGLFKWKSGNLRPCNVCGTTGRVEPDVEAVSKAAHADVEQVKALIDVLKKEETKALKAIGAFLRREKSTIG